MTNQMSSTPKRMLGCVLMGIFGFMLLFSWFVQTGSILEVLAICATLSVVVLGFVLMLYCFEDD